MDPQPVYTRCEKNFLKNSAAVVNRTPIPSLPVPKVIGAVAELGKLNINYLRKQEMNVSEIPT